jgi:hypothetical protein
VLVCGSDMGRHSIRDDWSITSAPAPRQRRVG